MLRSTLIVVALFSAGSFATQAAAQGHAADAHRLSLAEQVCSYITANSVWADTGLEDLRTVRVVVEDLPDDGVQRTGLTKARLERMLKAALLASGTVDIPPSGTSEADSPLEYIYLNVFLLPMDRRYDTMYMISLYVNRPVVFFGDGAKSFRKSGKVWMCGSGGISSDQQVENEVQKAVRDLVDAFAIDYLAANPRNQQH